MCLISVQSFIKIGGQVSEKSCHRTQRDIHLLLLGYVGIFDSQVGVLVNDAKHSKL